MLKIQKDQRKPVIHQELCDFTFQLIKCITDVQNYVQSAQISPKLKRSIRLEISYYKSGAAEIPLLLRNRLAALLG